MATIAAPSPSVISPQTAAQPIAIATPGLVGLLPARIAGGGVVLPAVDKDRVYPVPKTRGAPL